MENSVKYESFIYLKPAAGLADWAETARGRYARRPAAASGARRSAAARWTGGLLGPAAPAWIGGSAGRAAGTRRANGCCIAAGGVGWCGAAACQLAQRY